MENPLFAGVCSWVTSVSISTPLDEEKDKIISMV
jgi:hypothetical protein